MHLVWIWTEFCSQHVAWLSPFKWIHFQSKEKWRRLKWHIQICKPHAKKATIIKTKNKTLKRFDGKSRDNIAHLNFSINIEAERNKTKLHTKPQSNYVHVVWFLHWNRNRLKKMNGTIEGWKCKEREKRKTIEFTI